jgi:hypothetical protein
MQNAKDIWCDMDNSIFGAALFLMLFVLLAALLVCGF